MRAALLLGLVVVACKPLDKGAREHFARTYGCPEERVQAEARPELPYSEQLAVKAGGLTPPGEVKDDLESLAQWKTDHGIQVYAVSGCDQAALLACLHPVDKSDGAVLISETACVEAPAAE
ncbi:MAG: hypothetical protein IAG13_20955 [Deltaproteobacteria bacterium]|nr:hypothetical protein [Nannocystaceae bacterium]